MQSKKLFSINLFLLYSFLILFVTSQTTVYPISETVSDDPNYNKASFKVSSSSDNYYFKYSFATIPESRIGAFRFDFDQFDSIENKEVICTFVDESASDDQIISALDSVTDDKNVCKGAFKIIGIYDGIFEYDKTKKMFVILLKTTNLEANVAVYVRNKETALEVKEQEVNDFAKYSLVPYVIHISQFRQYASKILFYSRTRDMQMYYVEDENVYPARLFFGNIMSVYTNPNMVRQKYKNANTMILLTRPFDMEEPVGEQFQFQVKFFASDYLLDYYMGTNALGREKNSPLAINVTECAEPYYVILNYNQPEGQVSLYIDEIYGKVKSLSVATSFTKSRWDEMLEKDLVEIDLNTRKYELPKNSQTHMDVYKVECAVPSLLNFYYIDENEKLIDINYGKVVIKTLKANKILSLPFASDLDTPQVTIEVFNPTKAPFIMINSGDKEFIVNKNSLVKITLLNSNTSLVIKERGGDDNTRVIVKVGFNTVQWEKISDYVLYNKEENIYVFYFPLDDKRYKYIYALLETSGTNSEDNVKYCYGTNIGSAILPSTENCYRVSKDNSYTIKLMNPKVMYRDYDFDEELIYYVSLRPTGLFDNFEIKVKMVEYDAEYRNEESKGNVINLNSEIQNTESTILVYPKENEEKVFYQITSCTGKSITYTINNAYKTSEIIVPETPIAQNTENYNSKFDNIFGETELKLTGTIGDKIFVKHKGIGASYTPNIKQSFPISFDQSKNAIIFSSPLNNRERLTYTVYVTKEGELSTKGISICSLIDAKDTLDKYYSKTFTTYNDQYTLPINFLKVNLKKDDKFEAIAFIEQDSFTQMSFITNLLTGTVGEIKKETITEISTPHFNDSDYVYYHQASQGESASYYYSFKNSDVFDVPVGAFRIELDKDSEGAFNTIYCAWVDDGEDEISMVDAIDKVIDEHSSYCIGGRNKVDNKRFNYIFKYSYTSDNKPRRMVIKVPEVDPNTGFNIYIRKGKNIDIVSTKFDESKEYGNQEEYKLSLTPYILDLPSIRGNDDNTTDYISKVLIYSKHFEMQMYYIDSKGEVNSPQRLFVGNVMLVLTKPSLAEQKYFSTKLILLSEYIRGQEHSALGNSFRFHTKMFRSSEQIEYFVSNDPQGRTLNFPLSIEMSTCNSFNNKYYYILNYNKAEEKRNLYLDLILGSINTASIVTELTEEKWDDLIKNKMSKITDNFVSIPERSQHIDIIEIKCNTPLLANIYYNYDNYPYSWVTQGEVVIKNLNAKETFTFYLDTSSSVSVYYSVEVFNAKNDPNIILNLNDGVALNIKENSLRNGILFRAPESINVVNEGSSISRFIFKVGFQVDSSWIDEKAIGISGTLYSKANKYVYKFPTNDQKKNYTNVELLVKPKTIETEPLAENVKFCYSTSLCMPIDSSKENCFRTGANIPYTLTFVNPLISPKNYKSFCEEYYITLSPQDSDQYISLSITENKYETKDRNIEGYGKVLVLDDKGIKDTILSLPELFTSNAIIIQLQACLSSAQMINYINYNAYTSEFISDGNLRSSERFYYYEISNNYMETRLVFEQGNRNDKIFVKHTGVSDYEIKKQDYSATFIQATNDVKIIKPIFGEEFMITVLVGKKGAFDEVNLCTFLERKQGEKIADYESTFSSITSDEITHHIEFRNFNYDEGTEFDLLVYAVQTGNSKLEFLYPVISGVVGKIQYIFTEIKNMVQSDLVNQNFTKNSTNYLYYDFISDPLGGVASLKIKTIGEERVTITKIICTITDGNKGESDMLDLINRVPLEGTNICKGNLKKNSNGYDALVNAGKVNVNSGMKRLLIMLQYGFGENGNKENKEEPKEVKDDSVELSIYIRIKGFDVSESDKKYNENEDKALVPYVLDLKKIRGDSTKEDYISKVLIYSSKRELEMYHLKDNTPTELFSGNILLVYTNEDVIKEKYKGATTMILLTESLSKDSMIIIGENFRFKTYFFKSDNTMNYFVSSNPNGRPINIPTIMELPSCDKKYYYILNYHYPEERDLTLHVDKIYGEISTKRIATQLSKEDWYDLIDSMEEMQEDEFLINQKDKYHMDVIEATCTIPTLLNIYYTDDENPILSGLGPGDTSIINLDPNQERTFELKTSVKPGYTLVYSFNVLLENNVPSVKISFSTGEPINVNKNGVYLRKSDISFEKIHLKNEEIGGSSKTRVIFKYGYEIENQFDPIENGLYHKNDTDNLFGYKFKTDNDWLNYTSISFTVSTDKENVKFCYSTNLGSFMEPSLQDCYRVGKSNSYTLTILNPYLMYKDYTTASEEIMKYYVGFKTVERDQNITITPKFNKYSTNYRNLENIPTSVMVKKTESTILTAPSENNKYIFFQMQICSDNKILHIDLFNAYNHSTLNHGENIESNQKTYFSTIENTKLDTELNMTLEEVDVHDMETKVFVRHIGMNEEYYPYAEDITLSFDRTNNTVTFNQPIANEEFKYTIYVDHRGNLKEKNFNLCSVVENSKLAHYSKMITSSEAKVNEVIDFESEELKDYGDFDLMILAEQINNGKMMFLSNVLQGKAKTDDEGAGLRTELIIIIVVLTVALISGGIVLFICLKRYKDKPTSNKLDAKQTSLAMVDNENDKLIMSTATEKNE